MSSRSLEASGRDRPAHDPWRHQGVRVDEEPDRAGGRVRAATVFLTGRECPWRCVMCDLWRYTTVTDTPAGAIPHQIADALSTLRASGEAAPPHLKLYNAGSFFDPRAVPPDDDEAIAAIVGPARRVIVESHPALVGDRTWRFQEQLRRFNRTHDCELEVAMGLETAHPAALEQLQKHLTVEGFASAAAKLAAHGVRLRVFLLVRPPFIAPDEQDDWLARSVDAALACGASTVSLIPTRLGNGPLDVLEADGAFRAPVLADLERSFAIALRVAGQHVAASRAYGAADRTPAGDRAVLADLWDVDRLAACRSCVGARRARLDAMNLGQRVEPAVACADCGGSVA
jgi:radical SAM enzyme (TIGR01210 family)